MAKRILEIKVALFFIVPALFLIVFIVLKLGYSISSNTIDVYLKIDNIKMIKEGTSVKVRGYDIGRVVDIEPVYEPELHFLAKLRIRDKIFINEDCVAVIQNQNVIGDAVIELKNPVRRGNAIRNGDVLEGIELVTLEAILGDVHNLLATATETIAVFKDISSESKQNIRKMFSDLSDTSGTLNTMVTGSQGDIIKTAEALRQTSETMKEISDEIKNHPLKFLLKE